MKAAVLRAGAILLTAVYVTAFVGCGEIRQPGTADTEAQTSPEAQTSAAIFKERCGTCHADPDNKRAPRVDAMAQLSTAHIAFQLTNGTMQPHAEGLRIDQISELAQFIGGNKPVYRSADVHFCADKQIDSTPVIGRWGVSSSNTAALPDGAAAVSADNVDQLELAWVFGLPDVSDARSQPVVTHDTLFIAATSGHLFALDRASGCVKWHTTTQAPPRTALTLGRIGGGSGNGGGETTDVIFYGDVEAHVNAIVAESGDELWRVDATISEHTILTGAPVYHDGRLIVPVSLYETALALDPEYECCVSHGAVLALDANTGTRRWLAETTDPATPQETSSVGTQNHGPSGVAVWSAPTVDVDRNLIYVGTGQNASQPATAYSDSVVALDLETGKVAWHFQAIAGDAYNMACDQTPPGPNCPKWRGPDHDFGASIILTKDSTGADVLLAGQKSGDVYRLDPDDSGRMIWHERVGAGSALGGVHWGMAVAGGTVFVPISDPPYPLPNYRPKPGLYALSVDDGDEVWASPLKRGCEISLFEYFGREAMYPDCSFYFGLSAAPIVINDLVFSPALDGKIRAWAADSGEVLWRFDTARPFESINGVETHGGSIDVAGVQAAGDMIYVQSGYSLFGQLPGNALLAFRLRGGAGAD